MIAGELELLPTGSSKTLKTGYPVRNRRVLFDGEAV